MNLFYEQSSTVLVAKLTLFSLWHYCPGVHRCGCVFPVFVVVSFNVRSHK